MIKRITFTGLDNKTNIDDLISLERKYHGIPIEWGILFSNQIRPRYPNREKVAQAVFRLKNVSAHLCGIKFREVYNNPLEISRLYYNFARIQLNFNSAYSGFEAKQVYNLLIKNPTKEFILQYNKSNKKLIDELVSYNVPNWKILFDSSGGRGKTVKEWPKPLFGIECSYSGGLGPDNLEQALKDIAYTNRTWNFGVDMESNIRLCDEFHVGKIEECLKIVEKVCVTQTGYVNW